MPTFRENAERWGKMLAAAAVQSDAAYSNRKARLARVDEIWVRRGYASGEFRVAAEMVAETLLAREGWIR